MDSAGTSGISPADWVSKRADSGQILGFLLPSRRPCMGPGLRVVSALVAPPSRRDDTTIRFAVRPRSEEHTSELQSLMRISYAVFCLKKKKTKKTNSKTPISKKQIQITNVKLI